MSPFERFISVLLVAGAALFQLTNLAYFGGIKPDLTLVLILVFSIFDRSWIYRLILLIVGGTLLKFYSGLDIQALVFPFAALLSILLIDYLPALGFISYSLAALVGTAVLSVPGFSPPVLLTEAVYNLLLLWAFYYIVSRIYAKKV